AQRQPVLDRSQRVERFNLDEEVHALRRQAIDSDPRRIADRLEDILIFPPHAISLIPVVISKPVRPLVAPVLPRHEADPRDVIGTRTWLYVSVRSGWFNVSPSRGASGERAI